MNLNELPNLILEGPFATQLGVAPNGLMRMVEEKTLPKPFARRGTKPMWKEDEIGDFFGKLHDEQSAYAPIDNELGKAELAQFESYVCPAVSSGHIGNRRPTYLALYKAGGLRNSAGYYEIDVYKVRWLQTQQGVAGETIALPKGQSVSLVTPVPWSAVRPGSVEPLVLFKLDIPSKRTLLVQTGVRRGGTISTDSLLSALDTPAAASRFKGGVVHQIH